MAEFVELEVQKEGVGLLTVRRPPLNVLSRQVVMELGEAATEAGRSPDIKALILWGSGRHFSAGADVAEFSSMSVSEVGAYGRELDRTFRGLAELPKVTIAAVNGYALGGGCELALTADFRFVSERATFGVPEIQLGIIPGAGGTQRLPRLVGPSRAKEMIFSGRQVRSEEAAAIGLADAVFPSEELLDKALEAAARYARGPLVALGAAKLAVDRGGGGDLETGLDLERSLFSMLFGTEDWRIGSASFLESGPGKASFVGR
jgi:enoyl-CoA hydratase/carnithine racemase